MASRQSKPPAPQPGWTDVKRQLTDFDRAGLLSLVHDLYTASQDNQLFLHARFGLGGDVLAPYKERIDRWISPDVFRKQQTSVSKAKQAISDYKKAVSDPAGLAELMVFYCECSTNFSMAYGYDDDGYYTALVNMFAQAFQVVVTLPPGDRESLTARLDHVCGICHNFGYGVAEAMDEILGTDPGE